MSKLKYIPGDIYYFTPFALDKNLGRAYNESMALLPKDDDWGVLMDGDTMFLHPNYGQIIANAIKVFPKTAMFTCLTNRVGNRWQLYTGKMDEDPNILNHKQNAIDCLRKFRLQCPEVSDIVSGMLMIMQKKTWKQFNFKDGLLGVDNDLTTRLLKANGKVRIIKGLYIFHYYRLAEGAKYKAHLL